MQRGSSYLGWAAPHSGRAISWLYLHRYHRPVGSGTLYSLIKLTSLDRANDIRFAAVFSKARRQRKMDLRAQKNAKEMQRLEKILAELETNEDALKDVPDDSKEFFNCMLTQMDWTELLVEDSDILGMQPRRLSSEGNSLSSVSVCCVWF